MRKNNFKVDFIGIGVRKAASSWIFNMLKAHPEICGSSKKEIHYFNKDFNYRKGLSWYKKFFSHCSGEKIKGEYSPGYLTNKDTARRIYDEFPGVKIIACLRHPIDCLRSKYRYSLQQKGPLKQYNSFSEAIKQDKELIDSVSYSRYLEEYFSVFPGENILILLFDNLEDNPEGFLRKVYTFLGVDSKDFVPENYDREINETGSRSVKTRSRLLNELLTRSLNSPWRKKLFELPGFNFVREGLYKLYNWNKITVREESEKLKEVKVREEDLNFLEEKFEPELRRLEWLTGKNLESWR